MGSLPFRPWSKESLSFPHHHNVCGLKGGEGDIVGGTPSHGLLQGHHWALGKLLDSGGAAGAISHLLQHPSAHTSCQILQASQCKGFW